MKKQLLRKLHLTIAPIVILPLLITVSTGVIYRISKDWFGLSRNQVHFLMVLHEGEYFGKTLEPVYVLLNGLGLLWMLVTGGAMLLQNFRSLNQANKLIESSAVDGEVETSDGK
ncbi:hypothetical protein NIES267_33890 [Calothrix parasitica NIES-267]|uniref:Peptidase n=1 Tax=Calothrix parasitica NIES-267 TaxID=1973488 RepID=A0A1Z4LRM7_9CYAN|nr:hypothetical protein NIES267_33890 [Calothrix parasitica NIES-267]